MPANNTSGLVHYYAGKCPGKIGLLISPDGWRNPPFYMPYALDNGCFKKWEPEKFIGVLKKAKSHHKPLFVVCPDVVGDAEATLKRWHEWNRQIRDYDFPLAFACQDGMEPQDVPIEAYCCFIGGTTNWKRANADRFKGICKWLHIGRVNTLDAIKWAEWCGADSCDGTGFFQGRGYQYYDFIKFFEGKRTEQLQLFG